MRAGSAPCSPSRPAFTRSLAAGDRLASTPSGRAWFEVAALDPERFLGLRAPIDLRGGRPFDTAGPRPRFYVDALWGFHLKELPEGRTRAERHERGADIPVDQARIDDGQRGGRLENHM